MEIEEKNVKIGYGETKKEAHEYRLLKTSMQEMGLEPTQPCDYRHLKPARLPFRHSCEQIVFYRISNKMSTLFSKFLTFFCELST